tara:strand:- start:711 stop:1559 length:849 start_codon:yes stop_codon:yes gene_type:complete
MIDRENFDYIKNIVGIKKAYDITSLYDILTVIKNNPEKTPSILIDKAQSLSNLQKNYDGIIRSLNDNDFVNFYTLTIELINKDIDTTLLFNVLKAIKHLPELQKTICDSFSNNQVLAKKTLIKNLDQYITEDSNVAILGSWYASILLPLLHDKVNEIWPIDIDEQAIKIGKNMFFPNLENVKWAVGDVFEKSIAKDYEKINVIINTSCEHMSPMKEWKYWWPGMIFALQSNNMFGIEGHINCVNSIDEFEDQLPEGVKVVFREEIKDTRGTRYMLVGKFNSL